MNFFSKYPRAMMAALLLLVAFAVISLLRAGGTPARVKEDLKTIHKDMVRQAELLAGTLETGSRVVVLEMDYALQAHGDRVYEKVFEALKAGGLDIRRVEHLTADKERGWDTNQPGFPYAEFIRIVEAFPEIDAVIALCGPPYGVERFGSSSAATRPKLLVAGGISGGIAGSQFKQGWLHAATVPRNVMENGKWVLKYDLLTGR